MKTGILGCLRGICFIKRKFSYLEYSLLKLLSEKQVRTDTAVIDLLLLISKIHTEKRKSFCNIYKYLIMLYTWNWLCQFIPQFLKIKKNILSILSCLLLTLYVPSTALNNGFIGDTKHPVNTRKRWPLH